MTTCNSQTIRSTGGDRRDELAHSEPGPHLIILQSHPMVSDMIAAKQGNKYGIKSNDTDTRRHCGLIVIGLVSNPGSLHSVFKSGA